ncbi:MAG: hypothetical protein ABEJ93_02055 [Candidatus Nanohalobium sp.]
MAYISELGELSLTKAENVKQTLENVKPFLEGMKEDYNESETASTGELSQRIRAEFDSYDSDDYPQHSDLNLALGVLDRNNIIEVKGNTVSTNSDSGNDEFSPSSLNEGRYYDFVDYLDDRIGEAGVGENVQYRKNMDISCFDRWLEEN